MRKKVKNIAMTLALVSGLAFSFIFTNTAMAAPADDATQETMEYFATTSGQTTPTETIEDGVGNMISMGQEVPVSGDIENEAIAAGYNVTLEDSQVTNNAYLAGYTVKVKNASIGGTAALSGYDVKLDAPVGNNIFIAGNTITLGSDTTGLALYAGGNVLDIDGAYDIVNLSGSTVTFNGTTEGDAIINAEKVIIGEDAVIGGTLTVTSFEEPTIPSGASIGEYTFIKASTPDYQNAIDVTNEVSMGTKILNVVKSIIYWVIASAILSFLFCALFHKPLDDSKEMVTKKPVSMLLSGFITLLALPVGLILICITFVGLPVAGLIVSLMIPMMFFSTIFAASSFGRFIFNKIKPGFNPVAASLLGTVIIVVIKNIPILGAIIGFACMIYTVGYFVQLVFGQMKTFRLKREVIADVQSDDM